jgi:hypothetical protein
MEADSCSVFSQQQKMKELLFSFFCVLFWVCYANAPTVVPCGCDINIAGRKPISRRRKHNALPSAMMAHCNFLTPLHNARCHDTLGDQLGWSPNPHNLGEISTT